MVKKLFIFFFVRGCKNTGSGDGEGVMIFKCMERRKIFHLYRIMEKYFNEIQNGCICYEWWDGIGIFLFGFVCDEIINRRGHWPIALLTLPGGLARRASLWDGWDT